ncbi:MAG: RCC1 domain-containing protein [Chthoniobacterales bacterium]
MKNVFQYLRFLAAARIRSSLLAVAGISALAALTQPADGRVLGWGYNLNGQLGNGSTSNSTTPGAVSLPAGVTASAVSEGLAHSLAIGSDGKLYAWGGNNFGQLGNGSTANSTPPVVVSLPAGVTASAIGAGFNHSLAAGSDGKLYAWGSNGEGELGNGSTTQSTTPGLVSLPAGVTASAVIAGGYHSLALGSDGKLYAWGSNSYGQLGNGSTTDSNIPVPVSTSGFSTGEKFILFATGPTSSHTLAVTALPPPPPPGATTQAAIGITASGATLNGIVNANGGSTDVSFDYGTTSSYGTNVAGTPTPVTGNTDTAVSAAVSGLRSGALYQLRFVHL